jgi:ubiquinone/menaquinone biosynthesis C-methylase UbiE
VSPLVFDTFADILSKRLISSEDRCALEIGAGAWTLLSAPALQNYRKVALNLRFDNISDALKEAEMIVGNSNSMDFPNEIFDCVMSCSSIEHDGYFWRTIAETKRVLKKGGLFVVGVPIYMTLSTDKEHTTLTYARHGLAYNADYYRFSEQAVREIFFEGYEAVTDEIIVRQYPNPYMIAAGRK